MLYFFVTQPRNPANPRRIRTYEIAAPQPLCHQHLRNPLVSVHSNTLTDTSTNPQASCNQHLQKLPISVANTQLITPLESALTHLHPSNSFTIRTYEKTRGAPPLELKAVAPARFLVPARPLCDNVGIVSTQPDEAQVTGDATKLKWSGNEIRETFLRFFESKGHRRVRSSSLVPHGDPTLLFTNAGMIQFKDVFLGLEKRDYTRATTAQKCVRAGGKHNDLENVGFTKRHHTFFEMMGNFSFGDYFKEKAIPYAWELITSPEWFNIPKDKLYTTVFGGADVSGVSLGVDEEALGFWLEQNVPADRVVPIPGLKDNFWAMGDTGPCGPCSEIFYDMGSEASEEGHPDCKFPCDCGRYVEIWNLVFMQFNRFWACERPGDEGFDPRIQEGIADLKSKHVHAPKCLALEPLPKPCVDTGMGLERVAAVLQDVISNYDTDLFVPLLKRAADIFNLDYDKEMRAEASKSGAASLRVIADHARAMTFLISDGVVPSNEGRGYVLRKIIRRAIRHERQLWREQPFLSDMVKAVVEGMCAAYPELLETQARVQAVVASEETRFARTLGIALAKLDALIGSATGGLDSASDQDISAALDSGSTSQIKHLRAKSRMIDGAEAFKLLDTYGLPRDFIEDAAHDAGLQVDWESFDAAMEEQRRRARASWKGTHKDAANPAFAKIAETFKTEKDFYHDVSVKDVRVEAIIGKSGPVSELKTGESGEVVLDRTVIYAESGGQVADTGAFYDLSGSQLLADVTSAYYPVAGLVAHKVNAKETLRVGDHISVVADAERRAWDPLESTCRHASLSIL